MVGGDAGARRAVHRQPGCGICRVDVLDLVACVRLDVLPDDRIPRPPRHRRPRVHGGCDLDDQWPHQPRPGCPDGGGLRLLLALRRPRLGGHVRKPLRAAMTNGPRSSYRSLTVAQVAIVALALGWFVKVADATPDPQPDGQQLYVTGCSSCHGVDGHGVTTTDGHVRGVDLTEAGAAGAYFQLSTGRMPLADSSAPPVRKPPVYNDDQIAALVGYVAAFGDGPPLPTVDLDGADLAAGGELYRSNCQACHSASGAGGALSYGEAAPALDKSEPLQVGAAIRSGPGQMPVFGPD